ncbi:hypothetical protein B0H19DRAFT_1370952 [Mycena capillaripes]|nr:hypothetical protein B0H19DRAFT_1370952 [Mycena capillaripes]
MNVDLDALVCPTCRSIRFQKSRIIPDLSQSTQIREILRSNSSPSVPLEGSLRDVIRRAPADLERYDGEIKQLQTLVSRLVSERAALAAHLEACRSIFSPFRRFPVELLIRIFELCTSSDEDAMGSGTTTPTEELDRLAQRPLLELSRVSSFWHKVAVGTPRLWSTIRVNTTGWRLASSGTFVSLVALSLNRSQDHPLVVEVIATAVDPGARFALGLLSQHACRWQHAKILVDRHAAQYLKNAKGNLQLLKTLDLGSGQLAGIDVFEVAPALTKVIFSGPPDKIANLPWPQIREFEYFGREDKASATGFSLARSLATGSVFMFMFSLADIDTNAQWPMASSNITTLTIPLRVDASPSTAKHVLGQMFQSLTLPYLQELKLFPLNDTLPVWHQDHFLVFSIRSSLHSHLISLELRVLITDEELLRCLSGLPLLRELAIETECKTRPDHISTTDTLLQGLTWKPDGGSLIPKLKLFSLTSFRRFTDNAFWDFVSSRAVAGRREGNTPFEIVLERLSCDTRKLGPELITRLCELMLPGELKFEIRPFRPRAFLHELFNHESS